MLLLLSTYIETIKAKQTLLWCIGIGTVMLLFLIVAINFCAIQQAATLQPADLWNPFLINGK